MYGCAAGLVDVGVVSPAQLERIDVERGRQLVHRLLEPHDALHHAGRAEGARRPMFWRTGSTAARTFAHA